MTKPLVRFVLCLIVLLLSGYGRSSAHSVETCIPASSTSFLHPELATDDDMFFSAIPPEGLKSVIKIHATEVREEEEDEHEEISYKKKPDTAKYFHTCNAGLANQFQSVCHQGVSSLARNLSCITSTRRYLRFRVFRI